MPRFRPARRARCLLGTAPCRHPLIPRPAPALAGPLKTTKKGVAKVDIGEVVQILKNIAIMGACLILRDGDAKRGAKAHDE